jgi:hydrogenase expression/formation protein HypC
MCLGIPGRIVATTDVAGLLMGVVDFDGLTREVCLAYVPDARAGDYVIVHVGFAISLVDEAEARRTLQILRALGDAVDVELAPEDALPPARDGKRTGDVPA